LHPLEAPGFAWRTEKAFDIGFHQISIPSVLQVEGEVPDRIPRSASGPIAVTAS
jgi:hypothetical protein